MPVRHQAACWSKDMATATLTLPDLGWTPFFGSQVDVDDPSTVPVRVVAVHRDRLHVLGVGGETYIAPYRSTDTDEVSTATVGDWLVLDAKTRRPRRLLQRHSLFKRRAAGTGRELQLIAANVDTLFIVSSCNQDFNPARLERYLALAREARVKSVIVLAKADLAAAPRGFVDIAAHLSAGQQVEVLDARDSSEATRLAPWCTRGQTVALVGSSGVGKSTLINTLSGNQSIPTRGIREGDDSGRHTTTGRALHPLPSGGWLVDTPGMRELQLTDVAGGVEGVFADVAAVAATCRFRDCRHEAEPGCAVRAAILAGTLDAERLRRWRKLRAEETYNTETLAERHARFRAFGKRVKKSMAKKRLRREE